MILQIDQAGYLAFGYLSVKIPFGMLRTVAWVIFLLPSLISNGQSAVDSLIAKLNRSEHDTSRIDILLSLSVKYENDSIARHYLDAAIMLSEEINDRLMISKCYMRLARVYDEEGNLTKARESLDVVREQLNHFHNVTIESDMIFYYGVLDYLEGNYNNAVSNFWKSLRLYEEAKEFSRVAACYLNIGNCYKELEIWDKAAQYFNQSLRLYQTQENETGTSMALGNLGNVYKRNHKFDSAIYCFNQSLSVNLKNDHQEEARIDLNNIGDAYLERGDYKNALPYFQESYRISKTIGSAHGMLVASFNIGVIDLKTSKPVIAIDTFQSLLKTAMGLNDKESVKDIYEILSIAYEDLHQYDKALLYRKNYETWKDSLINEDHLNQVHEQEIMYETEKKDKQILLLAKEKELQEEETQHQSTVKKAFIFGFVLLAILAGLAIYAFRQRLSLMRKNNEVKEVNMRIQLSELEMKALRSQINPHFLFNCLNSINRMIVKGENENASLYLKKFSKLVRLIVENGETNRVSLENELALIESYIQLEELRFKGKIDYEISVDEKIEKENTFLPPMVLQPFVENAIWHGLMHKENAEQGHIKIDVKEDHDALVCTIEDNGVGRTRSEALKDKHDGKTKSVGIKITEERLKLLNRERLKELIKIVDLKDTSNASLGTRVEINIPLA